MVPSSCGDSEDTSNSGPKSRDAFRICFKAATANFGKLAVTPTSMSLHFRIYFRECPKGEVRRIPIPRTQVNKGI